jgi:hypothetical protein
LYADENWTLWKVDQKKLEIFECDAGEGCERSFALIV